jgi:hypothetical protein
MDFMTDKAKTLACAVLDKDYKMLGAAEGVHFHRLSGRTRDIPGRHFVPYAPGRAKYAAARNRRSACADIDGGRRAAGIIKKAASNHTSMSDELFAATSGHLSRWVLRKWR